MFRSSLFIGIFIAALTCCIDQWHKWYMLTEFAITVKSPYAVTSFFNLVMVWNEGMSFGMLQNIVYSKWILTGLSIIICIGLLFWLAKTQLKSEIYSLGLIIGGAAGNVIDRFHYGAVADFFDLYIGNYHWPAFNLADSAICAGALLLAFHSLHSPKKEVKE